MRIEVGEPGALDLTRFIRPGELVAWSQACAEPLTLTELLAEQRQDLGGVRCFIGISSSAAVRPEHCDYLTFSSYSAAGANRALARAGALDLVPSHYSELPDLLSRGPLRADVLFLSLPPARPDGRFGFGLAADYIASVIGSARLVIAEINDQVPDIGGGPGLSPDDLDVLVYVSRPPPQFPQAQPREAENAIAGHIADLVPDGATLQLGIGTMPSAVVERLRGHRDLGVHSGMISDAIAELIEAGVITGARKSVDPGLVVTGMLMGTQSLIGLAAASTVVALRDTRYTHDPAVLAAQHRLIAINSATEVDLTGQANAETAAGNYIGAVGGAVDFARGAARSPGGIPILALPSTARSASRIVARLSGPVTVSRADAGVIVTEYGAADLRGLSLAERRQAMLGIAHPDHRAALAAAAAGAITTRSATPGGPEGELS